MAKGIKTGGRTKGTPNKLTSSMKEMALASLEAVGGQKYLEQQAVENPTAYLSFIGRFAPKDVNVGGQPDNPVQAVHKIVLEAMSDNRKG